MSETYAIENEFQTSYRRLVADTIWFLEKHILPGTATVRSGYILAASLSCGVTNENIFNNDIKFM